MKGSGNERREWKIEGYGHWREEGRERGDYGKRMSPVVADLEEAEEGFG